MRFSANRRGGGVTTFGTPPGAVRIGAHARGGAGGWRTGLRRAAVPVALVALWQALATVGAITDETLAAPLTVVRTTGELIADGSLPEALAASLQRVVVGFAIGAAIGVGLGVLAGVGRLGEDLIDSTVQMLNTVPFVALAPVFLLWFGIGDASKVAVIAFASAFPLYLNTFAGIRNIDRRLIESAQVAGVGRWELVRWVLLPGALPQVLVGLRYSLGLSIVALVVAEQLNAQTGIGALLSDATEFLQTDVMVVGLVVYALLGLGVDYLVRGLQRRFLRWRPQALGA